MLILMSRNNLNTLIHVAKYHPFQQRERNLFLRKESPFRYTWFEELEGEEIATDVYGSSVEEALRLAHRFWKEQAFRTIICGFRYNLPERDEHGMNALFYQMANSYHSPNGVYFDNELGHNCYVQNASKEALEQLKQLENSNRQ
jgi:hypothetical protein